MVTPITSVDPVADLAMELLNILTYDRERLERIDMYLQGIQDEPYMPSTADAEYKLLAKRSISNWMPLLVDTPAQALYVDGFQSSGETSTSTETPEWEHWQQSSLDARQIAIHRAALSYGHSFTVTEKNDAGKVITKGLSPRRTAALYEDAANDLAPYAALTITRHPRDDEGDGGLPGRAYMWDQTNKYEIHYPGELSGDQEMVVVNLGPHGAPECPVTRFTALVDLDGRTIGCIEPLIPLQNRINQTVFDLLVAQTYGSFKVRYATGMAPPMEYQWFDANGAPSAPPSDPDNPPAGWTEKSVPKKMDHNARRFLFAEDPDAKFGSLDETLLDGFISSIDMSIRHLSAIAQVPPHHLLGQIANLSAEALEAAETSLTRKVEEYRKSFGESWERVFRIAGYLLGNSAVYNDIAGEVLWRDLDNQSLAQNADALGKLSQQLGIPPQGLWSRVPGVTQGEMDTWKHMADEQNVDLQMTQALQRGGSATSTVTGQPAQPAAQQPNVRGNLTPRS